MSTQHMAWKHLFIHPADEHYSVERHVVGPSPCLPLLEVAVPFHTQPHLPYQAMPHVPRVSIDLLVTAKETNELGYEGAWKKHQEIFLERAREGISLHGTGLGDWYRSRYPNLRSRIEYLILLQDLPPVAPSLHTPEMQLLVRFSQSVLILAFGVMKSNETVSQTLQNLDSGALVERIKRNIEDRLSSDHCCPMQEQEIASRMRFVLVYAGGPSNQAQMEQLGQQTESLDISLTVRHLLCGDTSPRQNTHLDEIVNQAESARAFRGCSQIRSQICELSAKMDICSPLRMNCLPRSWAADLKGADKKSFNALVTEGAVLLNQAIHPGKSQQLFVIWSYTRTRCELGIRQHYKRVFLEATQSILARRTTSTELIVDTMVLFCLTKIAKISSGTKRPSSDILGQFNSVLTRGSLGDDSICLWRCLMSIRRVLSAWDFPGRNPRLVSFINQLKLPDLMPEGSEFVIDHYWSYRFLWKISHPEALDRARKQSGFFPINLPPLKLPEVRNLKADPESEEDCITCTTGYSSCSSYLVYTIIRWELLFSLDNSPTMAIHCRAILILFITSPMTATLLVVMFQRLQDDDGVFPPLVEQIFSDFRFTTHSVLRILCSNADNKPRVDNKPGVVGKV
ncbi:unnamed protein product [Fusarium langsethiae]|nr:unnamed protein product [Fusarium langsethiae]